MTESLKQYWDAAPELAQRLADAEAAQKAEFLAICKDAQRYRYLLSNHVQENGAGEKYILFACSFEHFNDVEASIDEAMQAQK